MSDEEREGQSRPKADQSSEESVLLRVRLVEVGMIFLPGFGLVRLFAVPVEDLEKLERKSEESELERLLRRIGFGRGKGWFF